MFQINHGQDADKLTKGEIKKELTKQRVGNKTEHMEATISPLRT